MLSFNSLHLRSARLAPPFDKWTPTKGDDDKEEEDVGPLVRCWFGQRVLWCRFQATLSIHNSNNNDNDDKTINNSHKRRWNLQRHQHHDAPVIVGRHLTGPELEPYRMIGDPIVDDLLQAMQDQGTPVRAGDDLLDFCEQAAKEKMTTTEPTTTTTKPSTFASPPSRARSLAASFWNSYYYSESPCTLPSWVDVEQLKRGQQVFLAYTPAMSYALYYRSFVPGFSIPKIAQVLKTTGYLTPTTLPRNQNHHSSKSGGGGGAGGGGYIHNNKRERVRERLMDTGAFIAACMGLEVSELLPGRQAWRSILQVRILHAKVRHALSKRRDWNLEEWGIPINAEDMAATLLAFSTNTLLGVEFVMGFPLSHREREDFLALWRYIGWLLGVDVNDNADTTTGTTTSEIATTVTTSTMNPADSTTKEHDSSNGSHIPSSTSTTPLRHLDPCGPGWISEHPNVIDHSNAMLQSIIFHILRPDELSVTIAHHLLRMRQPQEQQQQQQEPPTQTKGNALQPASSTISNGHHGHAQGESTSPDNSDNKNAEQHQPNTEDGDNLWFYYRALQCRRFVGDPLADALHLPRHSSWWTRQWLFAASTLCLVLVRWYSRLALPWSPLRQRLIRYHQRGMQQFWNSWLEAPRRMAQALAANTENGNDDYIDKKSKAGEAPSIKDDGHHDFQTHQTDGPVCPFAMVAPPVY